MSWSARWMRADFWMACWRWPWMAGAVLCRLMHRGDLLSVAKTLDMSKRGDAYIDDIPPFSSIGLPRNFPSAPVMNTSLPEATSHLSIRDIGVPRSRLWMSLALFVAACGRGSG